MTGHNGSRRSESPRNFLGIMVGKLHVMKSLARRNRRGLVLHPALRHHTSGRLRKYITKAIPYATTTIHSNIRFIPPTPSLRVSLHSQLASARRLDTNVSRESPVTCRKEAVKRKTARSSLQMRACAARYPARRSHPAILRSLAQNALHLLLLPPAAAFPAAFLSHNPSVIP